MTKWKLAQGTKVIKPSSCRWNWKGLYIRKADLEVIDPWEIPQVREVDTELVNPSLGHTEI